MINKITFTGREEMLTSGMELAAKKTTDFVRASSILPPLPVKASVAKPVDTAAAYFNPYTPIINNVQKESENILYIFG